jgi:hypothetical protein
VAVFLVFIPILFSLLHGPKRKYAWSVLAISSLIICLAAFNWGDAAEWYRTSSPLNSTSLTSSQAPLGTRTIRIDVPASEIPPMLLQIIPKNISKELSNHPISIGSWIWASKLQVDETPRFFLITSSLKQTNAPLIVALSPLESPIDEGFTTFYDGVILTGGNHPSGEFPIFSDTSGDEGVWSGEQFQNAVRNSSGEFTWPYVRRWVDNLASRYFPGRPSLVLASILDIGNFRPYYTTTLKFLFQSFWARFGWGNITLVGYHPYFILGIFSLVGIIGSALYLIRNSTKLDWGLLLFLGLPIAIIWGLTVSRGVYSYLGDHFIVPVARYAYPAIIPTMLLIDVGWLEVGKLGNDYLRIPRKVFNPLIICFFIALNIISIYSIIRFYQS